MAVFEFAGHFPHTEFLAGVHKTGNVIENDEAFDAKALDENLAETGEAGILLGVTGDKAAEDNAAVEIHAVEDGLHDFSANVFEVDVHSLGGGGGELGFPLGMLVVNGGVKAEIVFNPLTFFIGAGDADDVAAVNFAELSNDAARGPGGGGDDEGFAGFGLSNFEEAEVGGEAIDAEEIQEIDVGEKGNGGEFLERALLRAGDEDVFLKAGEAGDLVAFFIVGMAGFDDFGEAERAHDFAHLDRRHVLGNVGHPNAHGGVDGEIFYFGEGLAFGDGGEGGFGELQDVGSDEAGGAVDEFPLTIGGWHEERVEE